jgi:twitching motility protein PilU
VRPTLLGDLASALKAIVSQRLLRTVTAAAARPAVEVLLNTKLVAELIEQGDFSGVKEAMENSMAEGSQTFEEGPGPPHHRRQDRPQGRPGLRRLADQPDVAPAERPRRPRQPPKPESRGTPEPSFFTEITLDVHTPRKPSSSPATRSPDV